MNNQCIMPLREARHLAALTGTIREHLGGAATNARDIALIELTEKVAQHIHSSFLRLDLTSTQMRRAYVTSGKLVAAIASIIYFNAEAARVKEDDEMDLIVSRIGRLQCVADDLAEDLVSSFEQKSTCRNADEGHA